MRRPLITLAVCSAVTLAFGPASVVAQEVGAGYSDASGRDAARGDADDGHAHGGDAHCRDARQHRATSCSGAHGRGRTSRRGIPDAQPSTLRRETPAEEKSGAIHRFMNPCDGRLWARKSPGAGSMRRTTRT